jgi:hypothetical protein
MDFDTLFTNMHFPIEEFIDHCKTQLEKPGGTRLWEDVNLIAAPDWYPPPQSRYRNLIK